jgi:hypothetical protein
MQVLNYSNMIGWKMNKNIDYFFDKSIEQITMYTFYKEEII